MQQDVVANDVALKREKERVPATFETLEEISLHVTEQPFAGSIQISEHNGLGHVGWRLRIGVNVFLHSVARQVQPTDGINHPFRKELRVLILGICLVDGEFDGARDAFGKISAAAR